MLLNSLNKTSLIGQEIILSLRHIEIIYVYIFCIYSIPSCSFFLSNNSKNETEDDQYFSRLFDRMILCPLAVKNAECQILISFSLEMRDERCWILASGH